MSARVESSTLSSEVSINRKILEQVIEASAEPLIIGRVDHPDWPVAMSNQAFDSIGGKDTRQQPFADVIEQRSPLPRAELEPRRSHPGTGNAGRHRDDAIEQTSAIGEAGNQRP